MPIVWRTSSQRPAWQTEEATRAAFLSPRSLLSAPETWNSPRRSWPSSPRRTIPSHPTFPTPWSSCRCPTASCPVWTCGCCPLKVKRVGVVGYMLKTRYSLSFWYMERTYLNKLWDFSLLVNLQLSVSLTSATTTSRNYQPPSATSAASPNSSSTTTTWKPSAWPSACPPCSGPSSSWTSARTGCGASPISSASSEN